MMIHVEQWWNDNWQEGKETAEEDPWNATLTAMGLIAGLRYEANV